MRERQLEQHVKVAAQGKKPGSSATFWGPRPAAQRASLLLFQLLGRICRRLADGIFHPKPAHFWVSLQAYRQ